MKNKYRLLVEAKDGSILLDCEKVSGWTHDRMSAWLQSKFNGKWKRITVTSI
jgi:hypothetical protein